VNPGVSSQLRMADACETLHLCIMLF